MNAPRLFAACLGLILLCGCGPGAPEPASGAAGSPGVAEVQPPSRVDDAERPPDLLLIVVDTLRADHLSAYGYARPTSPRLQQLAGRGVLFSDVTAQSSWTLPSMASLLTGRHLFVNAQRLPSAVPSLAERLAAAGYETAAFVGNFAIGRAGGYDRGFQHFITRQDTGGSNWDAPDLQAALHSWLGEHPLGDRPRFLYLHFLDPHWPYEPPAEVTLPGRPRIADDVLEAWVDAVPEQGPLREFFNRDRQQILQAIDDYDREIAATDAVIGRLLDRLDTRPTMVVVAADHGECLWERLHYPSLVAQDLQRQGREPEQATLADIFFRDHSYHLFQELLSTPLIVAGPGFDEGLTFGDPVENVDIVPTLLRAAGLPDDPDLDGLALQDVLAGTTRRQVLYAHSKEGTVVRQAASGKKLIWPTDTGFYFGMPIMLFDLDSDPDERHNVAAQDKAGFRALVRLREQAAAAFHLYDGEQSTVDDEAHREALRQLGYVGAGFDDEPPGGAAPSPNSSDSDDTPPGGGR